MTCNRALLLSAFLFIALMCSASKQVMAQASATISYQGSLLDGSGKPVPDGNQSITFKIYDGSGTMVWSETQNVVTKAGIFNVQLGATTPVPTPFPANAELEITVGGSALAPRTKFTSAPYSLGLSHGYVGAISLNGHVLGGNGDTVVINPGSNVAFSIDSKKAITIAAGGNPSTITGVQAGKYLVGGGTSGVVPLDLAMPLNIFEKTIATDLVTVENQGPGNVFTAISSNSGSAGIFKITPAFSTATVLQVSTAGSGKGAEINLSNPLNDKAVVTAATAGTGEAGKFSITNAASTASVIVVSNAGTGKAISANQTNAAAINNAVEVQNAGIGIAGRFVSSNKTTDAAALEGENQGTGAAVHGFNPGKGRAGFFESYSGSTSVPTVEILSKGEPGNGLFVQKTGDAGSAGYFWNTKNTNTTDVLFALTSGTGAAISGNGGASGNAGRFIIDTMINSKDAVIVTTLGTGRGEVINLTNPSNLTDALFAQTVGAVGNAGHFNIQNLGSNSAAVLAETSGQLPSSDGVLGTSNASQAAGVHGIESKADAYGVHGFNAIGYGVYGETVSGTGVCAYGGSSGIAINVNGKFIQSGGVFQASPTSTMWTTNKPATVKLHNGKKVKLFAEEASEVLFNDYGSGVLQNGKANISLDPKFLETVTIDERHPMKVFIQLEGDCNGVYVTNKTTTGFDVVELHNGSSNAAFSYRIVCKRKYYEDERLATEEEDTKYNTTMLSTAWPEVMREQNKAGNQIRSLK